MGRQTILIVVRGVILLGLLAVFVGSLVTSLLADRSHHSPSSAIGPDPGLRVLLVGQADRASHTRLAIAPLQEGLLYCPDDKDTWYYAVDPPHDIILTPQGNDGIMVEIPAQGYTQIWPVGRLNFISRHVATEQLMNDLAVVEPANRQAVFALPTNGGRQYRGTLEVSLHGAIGVHAVNALPIEAWLEGVLQAELPTSWPTHAMRAQAIAARSYAYAKAYERRRHAERSTLRYDLTDSGDDPKYYGTGSGSRPIDWAIADTHGRILTYYGRPFAGYYHTASGGHTAPITHLISDARTADGQLSIESVLPAVVDPWHEEGVRLLDGENRYGERVSQVKIADIKKALNDAGYPNHTVFRVAADLADGNHAKRVIIRMRHNAESVEFSGHDFRRLIGRDVVRSTRWSDDSPRIDYATLSITTYGRGHGVGMSQISAYAMAQAGWRTADILRFFYVTAEVKQQW